MRPYAQGITAAVLLSLSSLAIADETKPGIPTSGNAAQYSFEGGDGRSLETAVIVVAPTEKIGMHAQNAWLSENYPGSRKASQSLLAEKGKFYDALEITTGNGSKVTLYFDISSYMGKF